MFLMFENPRRGRQARNFTENDPKILDLKSSSEQIIFRKLSLGAPVIIFRTVNYWLINISFSPSGVVVGAGMVVGTENNEVETN